MGDRNLRVSGEYRRISSSSLGCPTGTQMPRRRAYAPSCNVTRVRLTHSGLTHFGLTHSGLTRDGARAHRGWPVILEWLQPCVEDEC